MTHDDTDIVGGRGRYRPARGLSKDIDRFLDRLPVRAHRESPLERAARLVDRNRVLAYLFMRAIVVLVTAR